MLLVPALALAQAPSSGAQPSTTPTVQLPPVIVSAQKEPADAQSLPVSVTVVPAQTLDDAGIAIVSDAGIYAPNVHFSEFSARKPRCRSTAKAPTVAASPRTIRTSPSASVGRLSGPPVSPA